MITRYSSRAGRKLQVYELMYTLGYSLTMYQIADLLHLSRSSHFMSILMEMVEDGDLGFFEVQHRPNSVKRLFYLRVLAQPQQQLSMAI